MPAPKMSAHDFAWKVVNEGSLSYALVDYGLGSEDLDPDDDEARALFELLQQFEQGGGLELLRKIDAIVEELTEEFED